MCASLNVSLDRGACRNVQRFRGGLVFKAHRLCVSLNSRLERNEEEKRRLRSGGRQTPFMVAVRSSLCLSQRGTGHEGRRRGGKTDPLHGGGAQLDPHRRPPLQILPVERCCLGKGNSNSHGARPVT